MKQLVAKKRQTMLLICFVIIATLVQTKQEDKEYDDPASPAYTELMLDYIKFEKEILLANIKRPLASSAIYFLRPHEKSCQNRCGERRNSTVLCHCDHLCPLYEDCCVDYWPRCDVTTKPFNRSSQAFWQCVDAKYKQPEVDSGLLRPIAYAMITRCPATNQTNNESLLECLGQRVEQTSISEVIPVTGDNGRTYRNSRCAKCHGIDDVRNMTFWGLTVVCMGKVNKTVDLDYHSKYLKRNCTWYYSPRNTTRSRPSPCSPAALCKRAVNTTLSLKFTDLVNKCKSYMQLVYNGRNVYKNFHCAACNGIPVNEFRKPPWQLVKPSLSVFFDYETIRDDQDAPSPRDSSDDVIGSYVTIAGLSISILCLLMVVVTYAWFPKLRTVPGLVLLSLSLSLLAYQALLLASPLATSQFRSCKAVAVVLHFTVVAAFSWMTIMSYDVTKTFAMKGKSSGRRNSTSSFRWYLMIAMSIPVIIVGLSLVLGETNVMDVGYGESKSCWIGEKLALILFFHVPVGVMLLFNTVALIRTIISIRKVTKLTKNVQKSTKGDTRGQNAKIYSKLSTVMGMTWFLGFGVSYSVVIFYLYIILNSLQGVFIFMTFVLNKRTINMWRYTASTHGETATNTQLTRKSNRAKSLSPTTSKIPSKEQKTLARN